MNENKNEEDKDEELYRINWETSEDISHGQWVTHDLACEFGNELIDGGYKIWIEKKVRDPEPSIRVPVSRIAGLEQKAREYDLFLKANKLSPYPLRLIKCSHQGCKAISVTDRGRGLDVYDGCKEMYSCDFQYNSCNCDYYCNQHRDYFHKVFINEGDEDMDCCDKCWNSPLRDERLKFH